MWTREQALDEIDQILRDAAQHAAVNGGRWRAAMHAAELDAARRVLNISDEARADAIRFASLVAGWLLERSDLPSEQERHEAARQALKEGPASNWLAPTSIG
jgi:hypothetical protein